MLTLVLISVNNSDRSSRCNERKLKFWKNVKRAQTPEDWTKMLTEIKKMALDFSKIRQEKVSAVPNLDEVVD
ncbi:hypothetical protein DERF_008177 [Dermatophagoides farinae]|uniref:Uncharacterized protein n=1 Tax=Dermatophagoides farinae TaxID=6954 RepID=A0A922I116_DERFA|nr:hypothetical protein DERF_008177 [Dermatophagoides farinae]